MIGAFHSDQWGGFKTYGVFPVLALTVRKDHGPRHRAGDVGRPDRCGILVTVVRLRAADATCAPAGPSASLAETRNRVCNSMRQAGLEPTTFGSEDGPADARQRQPTRFEGVGAGWRSWATPPSQPKVLPFWFRVLSQSFTSSSATPCPARSAARASATRRKNSG